MSADTVTDLAARTTPDDAPAIAALAVRNVSHSYGSRQALQDVSLTVAPSRFTALLGLNGAGKTTLFSLITRLYDTRHGSIDVLGHRVSREPGRALRLLGVVFQARTLDLDISVIDNLLYHAALHGIGRREARKRALAALQEIELADRASEAGYRADRCGGSRLHVLCCTGRASWCWMNRQSGWTLRPAPPSFVMCARSSAIAALRCCGRPTFSMRSPPPMRSWYCTKVAFWRQAKYPMSWHLPAPPTCAAPSSP
jgi:hypothetical protein